MSHHNPAPMDIDKDYMDEFSKMNDSGQGFPVGADSMTPREAAQDETYEVLHEDCEGNVLCLDEQGQLVVICDIHGPWACIVEAARYQ